MKEMRIFFRFFCHFFPFNSPFDIGIISKINRLCRWLCDNKWDGSNRWPLIFGMLYKFISKRSIFTADKKLLDLFYQKKTKENIMEIFIQFGFEFEDYFNDDSILFIHHAAALMIVAHFQTVIFESKEHFDCEFRRRHSFC